MDCTRCASLMLLESDPFVEVHVCKICGNRIYGRLWSEVAYQDADERWRSFVNTEGLRYARDRPSKSSRRKKTKLRLKEVWRVAVEGRYYTRLRRTLMDAMDKFVTAWNEMADEVHQTAVEKGWWDSRVRIGESCKSEDGKHTLYRNGDSRKLKCKECGMVVDEKDAFEVLWMAATERNKGEIIALIHSELSEALEGLRHGDPANDQLPQFKYSEVELADVLIRVADASKKYGWKVGEALAGKSIFNKSREHRHGGKAF